MKKTIQVRMDKADVDRLKREAERSGHTVSSFARFIILEYLKKQEA